jgi:hypothetical protein
MEIQKNCCFAPGHFYSPIVNTEDILQRSADIWPTVPQIEGIDFNDERHRQILKEWFPAHIGRYDYPDVLPETPDLVNFFTGNGQFSHLDSRTLFVMLKELRPQRMIEVGAGFSSLLTADVNRRFLDLRIDFICIEPYPRPFLEKHIDGISRLVKERVEKVPYELFAQLERGDILFIDSSHVSKTGSDVNYLYFEILPRLKPGVIVHIHDIFLPHDYPKEWVLEQNRSWNEQYLLRAMLMYSTRFRVLFGSRYAAYRFPDLVVSALADPNGRCLSGGSFWIERL